MCRRERDALIFTNIKTWEREELGKLPDIEAQKKYIGELAEKKKEVTKMFERTPQSLGNKNKRWRIAADIEQLQWRIDNL